MFCLHIIIFPKKKNYIAVAIGNMIIVMLFFYKHQHYWIKSKLVWLILRSARNLDMPFK